MQVCLQLESTFRVRSEAVGRLAWFMANETDSVKKQPQFSEIDVSGLTDLFMVETPRAFIEERSRPSVFQVNFERVIALTCLCNK